MLGLLWTACVLLGSKHYQTAVRPLTLSPPRQPEDGELVIEVRAAGVGHWDEITRGGGWDLGLRPPMALGVEAAGVVRAVGGHVGHFRVGDRVPTHSAPLRWQGAWAEEFLVGVGEAALLPDAVSFEVGASLPVPALTADQTLKDALSVKAGETLLVHGGGGVTGRLMVELAVSLGAMVVATASARSARRLRDAGAAHVVDYGSADWANNILRWSGGHGVDAALTRCRARPTPFCTWCVRMGAWPRLPPIRPPRCEESMYERCTWLRTGRGSND